IASLPVAKEKYDYVNKRITSWEGYLKVLYKNANIEDIDGTISSIAYNADNSKVTLGLQHMNDKEWNQLKGLNAYTKGIKHEVGEVVKVHRASQKVEIELSPNLRKLVKEGIFDFESDSITFSNASTKSQLNRLLKGFERLKEGLAANPNLENFLFEDDLAVAKRKNGIPIDFHNQLNEYQREAVIGAIEAEDLYVIQGPPGTGKTTVISEICYQNVKLGLKTLIASQSNLAVDNALGRLLSNKDIRILRYGRTDSIEEEGKKFIEENVAEYWKDQTFEAISKEIKEHDEKEAMLNEEIEKNSDFIEKLQQKIVQLEKAIDEKRKAEEELQDTLQTIAELKKQILPLKKEREKIEKAIENFNITLTERQQKLKELESILIEKGSVEQIQLELDEAEKSLKDSENLIAYIQMKEKLDDVLQQQKLVVQQLTNIISKKESFNERVKEIQSYKKLDEVESFIDLNEIKRGFVLSQLFLDMEKIYHRLQELKPVKQLSERIEKAIEYNLQTLNIQVDNIQLPPNHTYSIMEVDGFLNKLALAFKQQKINRQNGIPSIQGLYLRRLYVNGLLYEFKNLADESKVVFEKIKQEVIEQLLEKDGLSEKQIALLKERERQLGNIILQYEKEMADLQVADTDFLPSISELQTVVSALNEKITTLMKQQEDI
ncbi:MAG: AAA family ATPase, partial [Lysinibacillus sp.]|nr:AAA family ATPase [Lysinibacillus sp.]